MAQYTGIQGQNILITATDPSNPIEGQIWYNSTSNTLKGYQYVAASWATSGSLSTARGNMGQGSNNGTQTAYLISGGSPGAAPPSPVNSPNTAAAEKFNGTAWTSAGSMPSERRSNTGAGTQTASMSIGGALPTNSASTDLFLYDGSSWTSGTGIPDNRRDGSAIGTQTAALYIGGFFAPPSVGPPYANNNNTFVYNGSSWTSGNTYPTDIYNAGASGVNTAAIATGGTANPFGPTMGATANVNSWNGTSWTGLTAIPAARDRALGSGTQNSQLAFGLDYPNTLGYAYIWNGASWTTGTGYSTFRGSTAGGGTSSIASLAIGGDPFVGPRVTGATELYNGAQLATRTVTTS
jgi:hypothetical protein